MPKKTIIAIAAFALVPALGACESSVTEPELLGADASVDVPTVTTNKGIVHNRTRPGIGTTPRPTNKGIVVNTRADSRAAPDADNKGIVVHGTSPGIGTTPRPANKGVIGQGSRPSAPDASNKGIVTQVGGGGS